MKDDTIRTISVVVILILIAGVLITAIVLISKYEQNKLNDSCKDLGYEEFVDLGSEEFCIDDEGYYYKVSHRNFDVFEIKFREEVLR